MTSAIFVLSYLAFLSFSIIKIQPYLFPLWICTSYILAFLVVIIFYILNFPFVLMFKSTNKYKVYLMRSLAAFLNRFYLNMKIEVQGVENVPKDGSIVVYSNHKSYTDAFVIMQYFPRPLTLTPKKSVLKIPFFRSWLKAYDVFPINRDNPRETLRDLEAAVDVVKNGQTILLFPEGSIRDRLAETVENAKAGAFKLVKKSEAGLLPIRLDGNGLVRKRWPKRTKRKVTIFPVIPYSVLKDLSTREIAKLFMDTINYKSKTVL